MKDPTIYHIILVKNAVTWHDLAQVMSSIEPFLKQASGESSMANS